MSPLPRHAKSNEGPHCGRVGGPWQLESYQYRDRDDASLATLESPCVGTPVLVTPSPEGTGKPLCVRKIRILIETRSRLIAVGSLRHPLEICGLFSQHADPSWPRPASGWLTYTFFVAAA